MTRLRRISFNLPSEENISNADRHQRSLYIDDSCILQIDENFDIKKLVGTCSEIYCFNKCKILPCHNICKQLFSCSCQDYRNGNICKHIHKIHAFINMNAGAVNSSNSHVDFTSKQHSYFTDTDNSMPSRNCSGLKIKQIEQKLNFH